MGDLHATHGTTMRNVNAASWRDRWPSLRSLTLEVFGYGLVSALALSVDAGILKALVTLAGWHYLFASTVSYIVGAVVAYVLSVRFVFHGRHVNNRALEFCYFLGLGLVGLLVNAATLSVAISGLGFGLMIAKLIAAVCTFATNYLLRRVFLFSAPRTVE